MAGSRQPRRALALATCVLWLLAVEVLPNLHLGHHDGHHTHADDGTIVRISVDDHDHDHDHDHEIDEHADGGGLGDADQDDDHDVDHDDDHDDHDRPGQVAIDHLPHGHAADGITHHIAALHQPPVPITAPLDVDRMVWRVAAEPRTVAPRIGLARPSARGPPRA